MQGWVNAYYELAARLCSAARQKKEKKNATPRRSEAWLPNKPMCEPRRAPRYAHVQGESAIARQPRGFVQECTFPLCISEAVRTLYPAKKTFV